MFDLFSFFKAPKITVYKLCIKSKNNLPNVKNILP